MPLYRSTRLSRRFYSAWRLEAKHRDGLYRASKGLFSLFQGVDVGKFPQARRGRLWAAGGVAADHPICHLWPVSN